MLPSSCDGAQLAADVLSDACCSLVLQDNAFCHGPKRSKALLHRFIFEGEEQRGFAQMHQAGAINRSMRRGAVPD